MPTLYYPPIIDLEVTDRCNHKCIHCYNYWRNDDAIKYEDALTEKDYLKLAKRIIESKPVMIIITGGEPFMIFDKIKPMINLFLENKLSISINTNMSHLKEADIKFLKEKNLGLFVSFPCSDEKIFNAITDSCNYNSVIDNIKRLDVSGIYYAINMVVSKINSSQVVETAKFCNENFNTKHFSATVARFPQNANIEFKSKLLDREEYSKMFDDLLFIKNKYGLKVDTAWASSLCGFSNDEQIKEFGFKRTCAGGKFSFAVSSNGDVRACSADDTVYGNIFNDEFKNIISKMKEWQNNSFIPKECKACNHFNICGAGCRTDAKIYNNDICSLDTSANIANLSKFNYSLTQDSYSLDEYEILKFNDNIIYLEENTCIRLQLGNKFTFISMCFYDYIESKRTLTINDIAKTLGYDENIIKNQVLYFKENGFML